MINSRFSVGINKNTGFVESVTDASGNDAMNWIAEDGRWGRIHIVGWCASTGQFGESGSHTPVLKSFVQRSDYSVAVYENEFLQITVTRSFNAGGNFVENYTLKNISDTVITINRDNFGIEVPFNDRYTYADDCMINRCNTHIWCGHNVTWVNALKMGPSECNLGLCLTKGAIDSYNQNSCGHNNRGIFTFSPESLFLKSAEEYEIEWELFWHKGNADFFGKLNAYKSYIGVRAVHHTVFENEDIDFTISAPDEPEVKCNNINIPPEKTKNGYRVLCRMPAGEYRFNIKAGNVETWADFCVKIPFIDLLEKRINFIVDNQQCMDKDSPLYGAFLVYDNEYDSQYFDYANPDHNACRERMNIPLLLLKYLQFRDNKKVKNAMKLYIDFMYREFYDKQTGEVFNTIGKNRDQLRLYNAPGVMILLCEMYCVDKNEEYLDDILNLAETYYGIGGHKCYANGVAIGKIIRAFKMNGNEEKTEKMMEFFQKHVEHIMGNGTSYPKHEVNYEQTIVTPAVNYISEMGMLRENKERYVTQATKHMEVLKRFSGMQPSFHLNEISIRFWDDYWFGKNRMYGDTFPHHLSCLTSRAYISYGLLTGNNEYLKKAEECVRNCMCLIGDNGRGCAAYVYPYRLNGKRGEFYDPWSNDQDLVLYDALYLSQYTDTFKI